MTTHEIPVLKGRSVRFVPYGVITAMVTPFKPNEELDEATLRKFVRWQIESGMNGLACTAGSGEFVGLTDEERQRVLEITLEVAKGKVPVIAGILTQNTQHAIALAKMAERTGAAAILLLTPYYIKPSMDGVYAHFAAVAEKSSIPIILYNNPPRTGIDMGVDALNKIAEIPTVVGVKECNRDLATVFDRMKAVGDRVAYLSGEDDLALPTWFLGSPGAIVASGSLAPDIWVEIWKEAQAGNTKRSLELYSELLPLVQAFYVQNHPGPMKQMMGWAGHPVGLGRKPLAKVSPEAEKHMKAVLKKMNRLAVAS